MDGESENGTKCVGCFAEINRARQRVLVEIKNRRYK
jgi:hypothetical protein